MVREVTMRIHTEQSEPGQDSDSGNFPVGRDITDRPKQSKEVELATVWVVG